MNRIFLLLVIAICISSCAMHKSPGRYNNYSEDMPFVTAGLNKSINKGNQTNEKRLIIYNAFLDITIKEPDSINRKIVDIAKRYNGYAQSIGSYQTIIRVVADSMNKAVYDISRLGKLNRKSISGEDISEQYNDIRIKLENAEKARKRYLELLDKAQNVDETLKVEKELERLNGEIDLLKGKINRYNHLTDYSTITVSLKEKVKPGIVGYVFIGAFRAVKWLFVRN